MQPFSQIMIRQATELTARCAEWIHGECCSGLSVRQMAERYGIDESTVDWWLSISLLERPLDAPRGFAEPAPTQFKFPVYD